MEEHSFMLGILIGIIIGAVATLLGVHSMRKIEEKYEELQKTEKVLGTS